MKSLFLLFGLMLTSLISAEINDSYAEKHSHENNQETFIEALPENIDIFQ